MKPHCAPARWCRPRAQGYILDCYDGLAWKEGYARDPKMAADPRNMGLAVVTDGMFEWLLVGGALPAASPSAYVQHAHHKAR